MTEMREPREKGLTWGVELNRGLAEFSDQVRPALVRVMNGGRGSGAGVVVQGEGLVITSAHVLGPGRPQVESEQGRRRAASVLAVDRRLDLAALALEPGEYRSLQLGNSDQLRAGDWVMAFGHPLGVLGGATGGSLIGVGYDLPEVPDPGVSWLALSLHLRPGHSGGPVIDSRGYLVGISARMAGPSVGLAVAVNEVKAFLKRAFKPGGRKTIHGERRLRITG